MLQHSTLWKVSDIQRIGDSVPIEMGGGVKSRNVLILNTIIWKNKKTNYGNQNYFYTKLIFENTDFFSVILQK